MKKLLAFFLTLVMILSAFSGCAAENAQQPSESAADSEAVEEEEIVEEYVVEDIPSDSRWTASMEYDETWTKIHPDYCDACLNAYFLGYGELRFSQDKRDYRSIRPITVKYSDIFTFKECFEKDGMLVIKFTYNHPKQDPTDWELHAMKCDALTNISGLTICAGATVGFSNDDWFTSGRNVQCREYLMYIEEGEEREIVGGQKVLLVYAPETNSMYSLTCLDDVPIYEPRIFIPWVDYGDVPSVWSDLRSGALLPPEEVYIRDVEIVMGNETRTYQYRFGMSFMEWVNSEFNTDGWYAQDGTLTTLISPDGQWKIINTLMYSQMTADKNDGTSRPNQNYRPLTCFNPYSPLRIAGLRLLSTQFESWSDKRMGTYTYNTLGTKDDIRVEMVVYYEDLVSHMKVWFAPHSNASTTLPANATGYEMTAETVTRAALYDEWGPSTAIAAVTNYRPAEDPNFSPYGKVDMFVTYDDEVIYKITLAQFSN